MITRLKNRSRLSKQLGSLMLEVSIALIISALAAVGTLRETVRINVLQGATIEADALDLYRNALQHYVDDAYQDLQLGRAFQKVKPGVTLLPGEVVSDIIPDGTSEGSTFNPSIDQLKKDKYLPADFMNEALLVKSSTVATFKNSIRRIGCGAPSLTCDIDGLVWISQPYLNGSETSSGTNGPVIGQMLARLGGFGGTSVEGSEVNITGGDAAWTYANPVPTAPAGVVAARIGFNSSQLLQYVKIEDKRDPDLQGGLTITAPATGIQNSPSSSYPVTGATLKVKGPIFLENLAGIAYTANSLCAADLEETMVWGKIGNREVLMKCTKASTGTTLAWEPINMKVAAANDPCTVNGQIAQSITNVTLICSNNLYVNLHEMTGKVGIQKIETVQNDATVSSLSSITCTAPAIPTRTVLGVTQACVVSGGGGGCTNNTGSFQTDINAAGVLKITGVGGTDLAGNTAFATILLSCAMPGTITVIPK